MTRHSDLASVASMLQAAAQTLLSLSEPSPSDGPPAREQAPRPKAARKDEVRVYRVPFHILDNEQELLAEYKTDRLAHVLQEIYTEFFLMLELMQGYAERNDDRDFTYVLLAKQLCKPLSKLSRACSVLADFERQPPLSRAEA